LKKLPVCFELNGRSVEVWISPSQTLVEALRDELGATEVKVGCGEGVCGTCTVLLDGETVSACTLFAVQAADRAIVTVRGLADDATGFHPLQESFLSYSAAQCGFCTPGMVLAAYEHIRDTPEASRETIRGALAGNLCRCTGYTKIVDAVEAYAARQISGAAAGGGDE
jgi:carbon-monoxide dehydrogenase small subunit